MDSPSPVTTFRRMLLAFALPLGLWLGTVGATSWTPSRTGINLEVGQGLFRDYCGACHVLEKGITTHHGPNLYDIGRIAATRKPAMTAEDYILESILAPDAFVAPTNHRGMPRNIGADLAPEQIRHIVGYLASRGARANYRAIRDLKIPETSPVASRRTIRREDMELAESVVRGKGKCLECHTLFRNPEYQVFAPSLFAVGLSDKGLIRESIVDPSKTISQIHQNVQVALVDGTLAAGKLISQSDDGVVLLARNEQQMLVRIDIARSDIEVEDGKPVIVPSAVSPMPKGLDQQLTPDEFEAVLTMIEQLN